METNTTDIRSGAAPRVAIRRLMRALLDRARAEGIARPVSYVSADNHPVLGWIARAGRVARAHSGDSIVYPISLDSFAEQWRVAR
jgi:L-amino acid N-acyltransferase YncA